MFPNQPGGNSELSIACTLTTATGGAGTAYSIEDFPEAVWHKGAARVTAADGTITAGSATVTSATGRSAPGSTTAGSKTLTSTTANFVLGDVGRGISATSIPRGDTIATFTNSTTVVMAVAATTTAANKKISIADSATLTSTRQLKDAHTTNASLTVTSATAVCGPTDVGLPVTGANVPAGDYVATAPTATTITLHAGATVTSTAAVLTIGAPNSGAAQNGEAMAQLSSKLSLDPTTSVISFAGYVTQVKAATAGESQTLAHYDIVLPLLLTSAVVCPAPSAVGVASVFRFDATSVNEGRTGVGSLRDLKGFPAATTTKSTTAYVHVIKTGSPNTTLFTGSTACTETYPGTAAFTCGNG